MVVCKVKITDVGLTLTLSICRLVRENNGYALNIFSTAHDIHVQYIRFHVLTVSDHFVSVTDIGALY